jgi:membrane-associated phospholipid phosphatase
MTASQWAMLPALSAAVGLVLARRRLRVPAVLTLALVSGVPVGVAAVTPQRRWRYVAIGAAYMWSFVLTWALPYENLEKLRRRLQIDYEIRVDSLIGLGTPPSQRLQRALRDPPRVTALDKLVVLIYGSWFLPHGVLAWVLIRHDRFFPRAATRLATAYHLTTPFYYLVPTAPPWWASEEAGRMDGEVERVRRHVINSLRHRPRQLHDTDPGNPWGSMPSDHIASAAMTAMGLAEVGPVYGVLGWTYVALASFAVVYMGEHYVFDVIVGLAIAAGIQHWEPALSPLAYRAAYSLERLAG